MIIYKFFFFGHHHHYHQWCPVYVHFCLFIIIIINQIRKQKTWKRRRKKNQVASSLKQTRRKQQKKRERERENHNFVLFCFFPWMLSFYINGCFIDDNKWRYEWSVSDNDVFTRLFLSVFLEHETWNKKTNPGEIIIIFYTQNKTIEIFMFL